MIDRIITLAPLAVGLVFLGLLANIQPDRALLGQNDFVQLYTGAQLAGTPDLYSREANLRQIHKTLGFTMETVVYTRPPFYAVLLKPLSFLPYQAAYVIFSLGSLGCILWFIIRFQQECTALPVLAAMGFPLFVTLLGGQDTGLVLAILGAGILLLRAGRDFAAGLVLSLLAIKFHLFLFLPLALLLKRKWKVLGGGAMGGLALLVLGGFGPLLDYMRVLRDPWIHFNPELMPNLHGMASMLGGGKLLEGSMVATLLVGFVWLGWTSKKFELLIAISLVCGLLTSFHSGIADDTVLYPALVLLLSSTTDTAVRGLAAVMMTPIPFVMVLVGSPYALVLPLLLLLLVVLAGWSERNRYSQGTVVGRMVK